VADLLPHSPARPLAPGSYGAAAATPGLRVRPRELAAATLVAGKAGVASVSQGAEQAFGTELPDGPLRVAGKDVAFVGMGPGRWLVTADAEPDALVARLEAAFGPVASVFDQSGGLAFFAVSGAHLLEVLARLLAIDLDHAVFPVGAAAVTVTAHIGVTVWREDDAFVFSVGRSYATAFLRALVQSAAELGVELGS
jgi:methylglutamate dehydrogenase subunit D